MGVLALVGVPLFARWRLPAGQTAGPQSQH
jgi:hypothetical protein